MHVGLCTFKNCMHIKSMPKPTGDNNIWPRIFQVMLSTAFSHSLLQDVRQWYCDMIRVIRVRDKIKTTYKIHTTLTHTNAYTRAHTNAHTQIHDTHTHTHTQRLIKMVGKEAMGFMFRLYPMRRNVLGNKANIRQYARWRHTCKHSGTAFVGRSFMTSQGVT